MSLVVSKLKVAQLKAELSARHLPTSGLKAALAERLQQALDREAQVEQEKDLQSNTTHSAPPLSEKRPRSPSPGAQERPHKIPNRSPDHSLIQNQPPAVIQLPDSIPTPSSVVNPPIAPESQLSNGHHQPSTPPLPSSTYLETQSSQSIKTAATAPQLSDPQIDTTHPVPASAAQSDAQITNRVEPNFAEHLNATSCSTTENESLIANIESESSQKQPQNLGITNIANNEMDVDIESKAKPEHATAQVQPLDSRSAHSDLTAEMICSKGKIEFETSQNQVSKSEALEFAPKELNASIDSSKAKIESEPPQAQPQSSKLLNDTPGALTAEIDFSLGKKEPETSPSQLQTSEASKITPTASTTETGTLKSKIESKTFQTQTQSPTKPEDFIDVSNAPKNDIASLQDKIESPVSEILPQNPELSNSAPNHSNDSSQSKFEDVISHQSQPQHSDPLNISSIDSTTRANPKNSQGQIGPINSHHSPSLEPSNNAPSELIESPKEKIQSKFDHALEPQKDKTLETSPSHPASLNADPPATDTSAQNISDPIHTIGDVVDSNISPPATCAPQPVPHHSMPSPMHTTPDHLSAPQEPITQSADLRPNSDAISPPINHDASPSIDKDVHQSEQPSTKPPSSPSNTGTNESVHNQTSFPPERIERLLDSDEPSPTKSLYICNLVRPLTINQLKQKLSEFGDVEYFWIDSIRSHAYVTFQQESAAQATYCSMHQTTPWPPETGKMLRLTFVPEKEVSRLVAEEEDTSRSYGGRLGLNVLREGDDWKFELRQMTNGSLHQPRGLASSIPSPQVNTFPRSHTLDVIHPKELPRSNTDPHLDAARKKSIQKPELHFGLPDNYPQGGPEKWFKKTKTKPHLFYSPCVP